ncbi:MAG: hypothetical protein AAGF20_07605 [Pseudomonadota bacterium]
MRQLEDRSRPAENVVVGGRLVNRATGEVVNTSGGDTPRFEPAKRGEAQSNQGKIERLEKALQNPNLPQERRAQIEALLNDAQLNLLQQYDPASQQRLLQQPDEILLPPPSGYDPRDMIQSRRRADTNVVKTGSGRSDPNGSQAFPATDRSFGVGGAIRGTINKGADIVGLDQPYPQVSRTQSNFDVLGERLLADVSAAYDRPPSWLLQRIIDLTPKAGNPLQGPGQARQKLEALGGDIEQEINTIMGTLDGPLTGSQEGNQNIRLQSLQAAFERVQAALGSFGDGEFRKTQSGVQWRALD